MSMISIKQFTVEAPDSDNQMYSVANVEITNTTSEQISAMSYCAAFFDPNGALAGSYNTPVPEEYSLSAGESFEISPSCFLKSRSSFEEQDNFTVEVETHLLVKRVISLGRWELPSLSDPVSSLRQKSENQNLTVDAALSASIETYSDRDEYDLTLRAIITTDSSEFLHECQLEFVVYDDTGEELNRDWIPSNILKGGSGVFEIGFYDLDRGELAEGTVTATLATYEQVEVLRTRGASKPE